MISLNIANVMEEVVGEKGLHERELEGLKEKAYNALDRIIDGKLDGLAFLDLAKQDTSRIREAASRVRDNSDYFLLLGIGGSALGPRAILEALSPFRNLKNKPGVFIYDNVDPRTLSSILSLVDLKKTTVNVITKSGSTAETAASFMILWEEMGKVLGKDAPAHFIPTTDPVNGNMREIVNRFGLESLEIPPGVGGRYSVLSPVGLLLAEVAGIDSRELLKGAGDMRSRCLERDLWRNPALLTASCLVLLGFRGRVIDVMIPYADGLKYFSEWFCQLWAESLGKLGLGFTPYPSVGTTDQHSQLQLWMEGPEDKVVIFLRVEDYGVDIRIPEVFEDMDGLNYLSGHSLSELIKAEEESSELALARAGRPSLTVTAPRIDAYHLGQLFMFFEIVTALTGFLLGINPFNQPGVEKGKNFTYGVMGKKGYEEKRIEVEKAREKKTCWEV
ncbi:glucose-6-phosphate isomerase [bacterium BMS3Bbin06]|nr:glucose-6-phosphate isomerase [bacterium BMS3Abin08]GBE35843.1 glucose-6-phosphate isomerase [bacterium BMS3Bbin06]HDO36160.1 glucose-6-phosphate isomerase [Nitrospirota bacterium]HDY72288.1 glucose-6-phosphate isomerase [Nitrospirota bacterium]